MCVNANIERQFEFTQQPYGSTVPVLIDAGDISPDTPRNFGFVIGRRRGERKVAD